MTIYRAGDADLTLVRSDGGDWSLYAPDNTDEQIADGEAPPLNSGPAEWLEKDEAWDRPHSGDYAVAIIKTAYSLDELLDNLRVFEEAEGTEDCGAAALQNALKLHGIDISKLRSFGGEAPKKRAGVWSWDELRLLVGEGPFSEWRIVAREHWG